MNKNKITQFIEDNNLNFIDSESGLNSNCVILAGYALHNGIEDIDDLVTSMTNTEITSEVLTELERVFNYSKEKNYGEWWKTEKAKKMYKF